MCQLKSWDISVCLAHVWVACGTVSPPAGVSVETHNILVKIAGLSLRLSRRLVGGQRVMFQCEGLASDRCLSDLESDG